MSFLGVIGNVANFGVLRSIDGFTADVTIEEDATDELMITKHPVAQGALITDHAYKQPASLIVRAGWSNSSLQALGDPNFASSIYEQLLALQVARTPFEVQTGKRLYQNMLIEALRQVTDENSEYALLAEFHLQEIIIVQTQTTSVPPVQNQAQPQNTAAVTQTGTNNLGPAPTYNSGATPGGFD